MDDKKRPVIDEDEDIDFDEMEEELNNEDEDDEEENDEETDIEEDEEEEIEEEDDDELGEDLADDVNEGSLDEEEDDILTDTDGDEIELEEKPRLAKIPKEPTKVSQATVDKASPEIRKLLKQREEAIANKDKPKQKKIREALRKQGFKLSDQIM